MITSQDDGEDARQEEPLTPGAGQRPKSASEDPNIVAAKITANRNLIGLIAAPVVAALVAAAIHPGSDSSRDQNQTVAQPAGSSLAQPASSRAQPTASRRPSAAPPRPPSTVGVQDSVFFRGTASFTNKSATDLDFDPPRLGEATGVIVGSDGRTLNAYDPHSEVRVAIWPTSATPPPDTGQCSAMLEEHGLAYTMDLRAHEVACLSTHDGRIAELSITSVGGGRITAVATVWQNQ